ncbi:MAG: NAD(P)/FAD-dependent oxidoreductase [Sporichthyaceae bacterium]
MNTASTSSGQRRRIAVIGSGVSGLTAAWVLQRTHDVTLYEADNRLGGHAHTHEVDGQPIDTGFIVHNEKTYPTLLKLFGELGVQTRDSDMSMSVRCDGCGLEYAGARGLRGLFPKASYLGRAKYLRMLTEVTRFHSQAHSLIAQSDGPGPTLGEWAKSKKHSDYFLTHFLVPIVSCVWSCAPGTALQYPARYLFRFLDHHGMLQVSDSPQWKTVVGGSRTYVQAVAKNLGAVHVSTPVRALSRELHGVTVRDDADNAVEFDGAVVATHPNQALALLAAPTVVEKRVLGAIGYSTNHTVLHTDTSSLPRSAGAAASWNYLMSDCSAMPSAVQVSYDLNRLQGLSGPTKYVVTLNPPQPIDAAKTVATMEYEHPIYTPASVSAQGSLPSLDDSRVAFAGAYHGWGFHEDGAVSGLKAAKRLGGEW